MLTAKRIAEKISFYFSLCLIIACFIYISLILMIPGELVLLEGEEYVYRYQGIFPLSISTDAGIDGIIQLLSAGKQEDDDYGVQSAVVLKSNRRGSIELTVSILDLIPLKTVKVEVIPNSRLVVCGNTVGIKLDVDGILVVGVMEVETTDGRRVLPVRDTGIKTGDFITHVNGVKIENVNDLIAQIEVSQGKKISIRYRRGETFNDIVVQPVISIDDKKYHIGLWVRDNTAGIGTLTFYDKDTLHFGALGHGITDLDTGVLIPAKSGEILESNILAVKKSRNGTPGELKGIFDENKARLGTVSVNSAQGVYGKLTRALTHVIPERLYPIAVRSQVREGPATMLANVIGKEICEYEIEIQKISTRNANGTKGMIIKITDQRLLDITGGIVQGMSGSPIIQGGRIVGALTHVLVNDPSRGYGIFIECMVKKMYENRELNRNVDAMKNIDAINNRAS
ncbi:MAG: SpoIVB peptidase [Clostridiaceae bacterium]|nr:SpoIVB peptidase [Clostridiaceae bacterium]